MTVINCSKVFNEVQTIIYEKFNRTPRGIGRKGKLPKTIDKVALTWAIAELEPYREIFELGYNDKHPVLLGQCSTITEFAIRLQLSPIQNLRNVHSSYKLTLVKKRAEIMQEILNYYQTDPIGYFERCLKNKIDEIIPEIEQ
jgi:hypothetical protein